MLQGVDQTNLLNRDEVSPRCIAVEFRSLADLLRTTKTFAPWNITARVQILTMIRDLNSTGDFEASS